MRHRVSGKHLSRTSAHRKALRRNLASSLFEHGTISTTIEKAKYVRPFAEKLITLAKKGSLHARRRAITLLQDRNICEIKDGEPVKVSTVIKKLFDEIGPAYTDRNGGYTRIVRLPLRRIGDNGKLAILQLVGEMKASAKRVDVSDVAEKAVPESPAIESSDEVSAESSGQVEAEEVKVDSAEEKTESSEAEGKAKD